MASGTTLKSMLPPGQPEQRDVRQRCVGVAAADIAVYPGEPHLLQLLLWILLVGAGLLVPQRRLKRLPLLVDGQRVECAMDVRAEIGVVELVAAVEPCHDRLEPGGTQSRDA